MLNFMQNVKLNEWITGEELGYFGTDRPQTFSWSELDYMAITLTFFKSANNNNITLNNNNIALNIHFWCSL